MEDKIVNLIKSLIKKTTSKLANWERVGTSDKYSLTLNTGKIYVNKSISSNFDSNYIFSIFNSKGDSILHISRIQDSPENEIEYNLIKDLHNSILESFFRTNETIEGILGELNKDGEIGQSSDLPF